LSDNLEDVVQERTFSPPFYVDTNVLLSQYKSSDVFYDQSMIIVKALREKKTVGYTSPLTIIEMVSFVSRNFRSKKGETPKGARKIAISKILKEISSFQLRFSSPLGSIH
jgi:predicted nucleic acid-binding protein